MTGIIWGLLGASFIGVSDCVARVTARQVSMALLLAAVMGFSTVTLTIWMFATGAWPHWDAYAWGASAISGILNLIALALLYSALVRGPVSVASSATSSFSVILVALNALSGAPFIWQQGAAIAMVFLGIVMLSQRGRREGDFDAAHLRITALLGLAAAIVVAARMFLAQEAGDILGAMQSLYLNRAFALVGVIALLVSDIFRGRKQSWPSGAMVWLVSIQAILETLALGSFLFGSVGDGRIGASIGFSSFAAISALVAWVWLGEPIGLRRGFWMLVVASGIAIAIAVSP